MPIPLRQSHSERPTWRHVLNASEGRRRIPSTQRPLHCVLYHQRLLRLPPYGRTWLWIRSPLQIRTDGRAGQQSLLTAGFCRLRLRLLAACLMRPISGGHVTGSHSLSESPAYAVANVTLCKLNAPGLFHIAVAEMQSMPFPMRKDVFDRVLTSPSVQTPAHGRWLVAHASIPEEGQLPGSGFMLASLQHAIMSPVSRTTKSSLRCMLDKYTLSPSQSLSRTANLQSRN